MKEITRIKRRIDMAAGRIPADLIIRNALVVDVFTGAIRQTPVSVGEGAILGFEECEAVHELDAAGSYLLPGLIDSHIHIESTMATPERFAELVLPRGTTTVVADPHEIVNVIGAGGITYFIESAKHMPLTIAVAVPSCVPALPFEESGAVLEAADMAPLIGLEGVASIGEMMNFPGVIAGDERVLKKIMLGHAHKKPVDGHAPGILGRELDAYLCAGIDNTHECSTIEEMTENLRRGSRIFLRHGSAAKNLNVLLKGITPANSRRCSFCSDDRHTADILREGHLDYVLRQAVNAGIDPVTAVTMCTLNAAEAARLYTKGAIAPGYDADFILVNNLISFRVESTWCAGRKVAENGQMCIPLPTVITPDITDTMNPAPLEPDSFAVHVPSGMARIIGIDPGSIVTRQLVEPVRTDRNGLFECALNPGLNKVAVVERHKATNHIGLGILSGYGITNGAIATSVAHDSHNIVVVGDNDEDMRYAVLKLCRIGGGSIICREGSTIAALPLPVGGLMSTDNPVDISSRLESMISIARSEFSVHKDVEPFMTLSFVPLPVIPYLKLTTLGLYDVLAGTFVTVDAGAEGGME